MCENVFNRSDVYIKSLSSLIKLLDGHGNYENIVGVDWFPYELYDAFKSDKDQIESFYKEIGDKISAKQPAFAPVRNYFRTISVKFMYRKYTVTILKTCAERENNQSVTVSLPGSVYYSCNDEPGTRSRLAYARNTLVPDTPYGPPKYTHTVCS